MITNTGYIEVTKKSNKQAMGLRLPSLKTLDEETHQFSNKWLMRSDLLKISPDKFPTQNVPSTAVIKKKYPLFYQ